MHCVLFAESAVLLCLHSLRMVLFLFCHVVITLFAFSTCQCDFYAHDFHLHCVFALSLVILADQRRSLHFCPVFAARTSAISGIKKRPSSMSLVYCSTGTACCQQNSPKYAEIFYQDRIVHWFPTNCNTLFVRGGSGQEMILRAIFPARRTILLFFPPKKPYASDLESAFFIWLLSSKSTLCSVAPVSFFSISAILLFASSLNCVCFVSSVSPASSASY